MIITNKADKAKVMAKVKARVPMEITVAEEEDKLRQAEWLLRHEQQLVRRREAQLANGWSTLEDTPPPPEAERLVREHSSE